AGPGGTCLPLVVEPREGREPSLGISSSASRTHAGLCCATGQMMNGHVVSWPSFHRRKHANTPVACRRLNLRAGRKEWLRLPRSFSTIDGVRYAIAAAT